MNSLRIISGRDGGRSLRAPRGKQIHPMSERMRSALFSMLGDVAGLKVLDAFGGSGALGLEAASRGATDVVIVDSNPKAQRVIEQNIQTLEAEKVIQVKANVFSWLSTVTNNSFDVIFADPPYAVFNANKLQQLVSKLADGGLLIVSAPADEEFEFEELQLVEHREYGGASLHFWRK